VAELEPAKSRDGEDDERQSGLDRAKGLVRPGEERGRQQQVEAVAGQRLSEPWLLITRAHDHVSNLLGSFGVLPP
jgi:hypothetical protein